MTLGVIPVFRPVLTDNLTLGGGIVYDSDQYDEYIETINKLGANMQCIVQAEKLTAQRQALAASNGAKP